MTGLPEWNFPAFYEAEEWLSGKFPHGIIHNPARLDENDDHKLSWEYCMRRDLKLLLECDNIFLLKGWRNSRGATLENHISTELKIKRWELHKTDNGFELEELK